MSNPGYSKDNPFKAKVIEERLLTEPACDRETKHLVVDIAGSGLEYTPGDSLGVFACNRTCEVDEILQRLKASGDELVTIPRARVRFHCARR